MRNILLIMLCLSLLVGCNSNKSNDFSSWSEEDVFRFLNEIHNYISEIPIETDNKEEIVALYEQYFSDQLSVIIVDSLYVESEHGWKIPDGDGGYIFTVPNKEHNDVVVTISEDSIIVEEIYEPETWTYTKNQYTITNDKKTIITEWIMK